MNAEHVARRLRLEPTPIHQRLSWRKVVRNLTVIAICCDNQDNAMSFSGCSRERATHDQTLVIWMSVKRDDCAHYLFASLDDPSATAPLAINAEMRSASKPQSANTAREC
jgi:hypothetical protein